MDIVIYFENGLGIKSSLVIENKVKSLPRYEQLLNYTTSNMEENYLLLSLTKPSFLAKNNKIVIHEHNRDWDYINYFHLSKMLEKILPKIKVKNFYHALIIEDYIHFAKILNDLSEEVYNTAINGKYNFYNKQNKKISLLRTIRMHDFYLKLNHEVLAIEIQNRIQTELSNKVLVQGNRRTNAVDQEVFADSGFTRGSGITEIKYVIGRKLGSPIILGIQIQGIHFRLFIEGKKGFVEKAAYNLLDNNMWFDFSYLSDSILFADKEYPNKPGKQFNSYSEEFYYRSVKLSECKCRDLVDKVLNYVKYIHDERESLIQQINEISIE
ncbi:PD-(D/E)XK nuclease family protein [Virgibacillus halodenitrificans]|uniref:PD-(D/E)XK nuclease family protein n=1 Tax=Virgibacillus halodenitrificans TaxID=1482 RepID=UPI001F480906|nr:PD-(D/E)XK nuclease family protein [Virgibacillus halodenitrificans]